MRFLSRAPKVAAAMSCLKAKGRKFTIASKYTSAEIRPMASGLDVKVHVSQDFKIDNLHSASALTIQSGSSLTGPCL